ncbi:MAG: hypothetical protein TREMPRED_005750 [Tremellales sp. Tagirdzhanova-0007]|nr:MAG: hypothetical protein TREMPRED_005750 [Tremellales sp. Tagirdzhanova-0007]
MTSTTSPSLLEAFVSAHPATTAIRFVIVDYDNVHRCLLTSLSRARLMASDPAMEPISTVDSIQYATWSTGHREPSLWNGLGDVWLPSWKTLKPTVRAEVGTVMCSVRTNKVNGDVSFETDPREVLERLLVRGRDSGYEFKVAHEVEFHLLPSLQARDRLDVPGGAGRGGMFSLAAVRHPSFDVVLEVVAFLEKAGVFVWNFHHEVDRAEYEIALAPKDPLTAVDDLVFTCEVIRSIAQTHGYHATFHPRALSDKATLGMHHHISINNEDPNVTESFLAGMLDHLRSMTAILLGGYDSYDDARKFYMGDRHVSWSRAKVSPIRRIGLSRYEIRVPDSLGNPYLQSTVLIGAGLEGVIRKSPLTSLENPLTFVQEMDEGWRKKLNVTEVLPSSLAEAVDAMRGDQVLKEVMGEKSFDAYLWHRERAVKNAEGTTKDERTNSILWAI